MMEKNAIRYQVRRGWEQTSAHYALDRPQVFQRFADRLVGLLSWSPGQRVLDVGTGTGVIAVRAAGRVGASGQVIGVDCAWNMVDQAHTAAHGRCHKVSFAQMDAEFLGLPDESFDLVVCAFSLFQFIDMGRALHEMQRVLKPGGQLGLSNWGPEFFTPVAAMQRDLFREFGLRPLLTNPITFKHDQMRTLVQTAGLAGVELIQDHVELWFDQPKAIWDWNWAMGPFPIMLEQQLSLDQRQELERRYIEMLTPLMTSQGIACTFHPLYTLARKQG
jgi:ubiquinone/menaquinone biosynthesis C-methylase UbiE